MAASDGEINKQGISVNVIPHPIEYIGGGQIQEPIYSKGPEPTFNGMLSRPIKEGDVGALVAALESKSGAIDKTRGVCTHLVAGYKVTMYLDQKEELRRRLQETFPELYHKHTTQKREETNGNF